MKKFKLPAIAALAALINIASAEPNFEALKGICYGPFRDGQAPGSVYPSNEDMTEDVNLLTDLTSKIRTYGTDDTLFNIPAICETVGLDCYPGAWIDNAPWDQSQVDGLISILNSSNDVVRGAFVGSEFLLRNDGANLNSAKSTLMDYISQVQAITDLPVGTSDGWHIWNYDAVSDLAAQVDIIGINIHPYWESQYVTPNISIDTAVAHIAEKYNLIKAKYPGKRIVITETGWPSDGPTNYAAVPSEENQKRFVKEFVEWADANDVDYFLFSAYDEEWKGTGADGNFGLMYSDRPAELKPALLEVLQSKTAILAINPQSSELTVSTFPGNSYTVVSSDDLKTWQDRNTFVGENNTNQTTASYLTTNTFFRIKMNL